MQQRRLRLGDVLDDYCPRERRITNHVIVAMIDEQVKQTRCSTCDADHEYKQAKVPPPRRKKESGVLFGDVPEGASRPRPVPASTPHTDAPASDETIPPESLDDMSVRDAASIPDDAAMPNAAAAPEAGDPEPPAPSEDDGPVHRPLIRATLPRPEGQVPERKIPEFTVRQPGTRGREFNGNKSGPRHGRGRRPMRGPSGPPGQLRFGSPRPGNTFRQGPGQGQPGGNRPPGSPGGQRGAGPQGRGQRNSRGGRKRGR